MSHPDGRDCTAYDALTEDVEWDYLIEAAHERDNWAELLRQWRADEKCADWVATWT